MSWFTRKLIKDTYKKYGTVTRDSFYLMSRSDDDPIFKIRKSTSTSLSRSKRSEVRSQKYSNMNCVKPNITSNINFIRSGRKYFTKHESCQTQHLQLQHHNSRQPETCRDWSSSALYHTYNDVAAYQHQRTRSSSDSNNADYDY
jgi:hypothetical protein